MTRRTSFHPVKNRRRFTQSAGLVAIHPVAEAPEDEQFHSAWLLGHEAFPGFDCDPDAIFSEEIGDYGFRELMRTKIPGINLLDLRARKLVNVVQAFGGTSGRSPARMHACTEKVLYV